LAGASCARAEVEISRPALDRAAASKGSAGRGNPREDRKEVDMAGRLLPRPEGVASASAAEI
jgi:hypothetical protein